MKIPPDTNTRADAMWRIISQAIDFRGKNVIDLGCGHGEMLWRANVAGAERVYGIDINIQKIADAYGIKIADSSIGTAVTGTFISSIAQQDLNEVVRRGTPPRAEGIDIVFCFSVLPYLENISGMLQMLSKYFSLYSLPNVTSDTGMAQLLLNNGFKDVQPLGKTYVKSRDLFRTIWRCE
jgi:2-polyprenyl-3-methyl-5-hydroxy-6-metoxy-1,4-benzoquinol methylase